MIPIEIKTAFSDIYKNYLKNIILLFLFVVFLVTITVSFIYLLTKTLPEENEKPYTIASADRRITFSS